MPPPSFFRSEGVVVAAWFLVYFAEQAGIRVNDATPDALGRACMTIDAPLGVLPGFIFGRTVQMLPHPQAGCPTSAAHPPLRGSLASAQRERSPKKNRR